MYIFIEKWGQNGKKKNHELRVRRSKKANLLPHPEHPIFIIIIISKVKILSR